MRLVLIGDIHARRLLVPPWRLLGKRLLGQTNLWLRRRHQFDLSLLAPTLRRAVRTRPDLMLFSGDLTSTALEAEFEDVKAILTSLEDRPATLIVPGNHDRYTFAAARHRVIERAFPRDVPDCFPDVRSLNNAWRLLALDASVPRLLSSRGLVGASQQQEAATLVRSLSAEHGLVVLCHYPITVPDGIRSRWQHRLAEADALCDLMASSRARVIWLHGHVHMPWHFRPPDPRLAHVVSVNAGSPTLSRGGSGRGHGFWQIDLPDEASGPIDLVRFEPEAGHAGSADEQWTEHRVSSI